MTVNFRLLLEKPLRRSTFYQCPAIEKRQMSAVVKPLFERLFYYFFTTFEVRDMQNYATKCRKGKIVHGFNESEKFGNQLSFR